MILALRGLGIGPGVEQLGDVLVAVVAHHQRTPGWALRFFGGVVCRCERWFRLALRCLQLRTQLRHFGHQLGQVLGRLLRQLLLLLGFGLQRETRQAQALGLLRQTRLLGDALVLQQTLLRAKLRLLVGQALLLCHCFSLQALLISAAGIGKRLLPRCLRQLVLLTPSLGEPLLIPRPLPCKVLLGKLDLGRRRLQLFEQTGGPLCPRQLVLFMPGLGEPLLISRPLSCKVLLGKLDLGRGRLQFLEQTGGPLCARCFRIASCRVDGIVCDGPRGDCNRRRRVRSHRRHSEIK